MKKTTSLLAAATAASSLLTPLNNVTLLASENTEGSGAETEAQNPAVSPAEEVKGMLLERNHVKEELIKEHVEDDNPETAWQCAEIVKAAREKEELAGQAASAQETYEQSLTIYQTARDENAKRLAEFSEQREALLKQAEEYLNAAQAELDQAQAEMKTCGEKTSALAEQLDSTRAELEAARAARDKAEASYAEFLKKNPEESFSQETLDTLEAELQQAQDAADQAQKDYEVLEADWKQKEEASVKANAAFESANSLLQQQVTAWQQAQAESAAAQNAYDAAVEAYNAAIGEEEASEEEIAAARAAVEEAQAYAAQCQEAVDAVKAEVSLAQAQCDEAQAALGEAQAETAAAAEAKASAELTLQKAQDAAAQAQSALTEAQNEVTEAENNLALLKEQRAASLQAIAEAQALVEEKQIAMDEAYTAWQDSKAGDTDVQSRYEAALAKYNQGSYGFFKWSGENGDAGAEFALAHMNNEAEHDGYYPDRDVHQFLNIGAENDATNLDNMKESSKLITRCNELRAENDLDPLEVSSPCMAVSQLDLNFSYVDFQHASTYNLAENIASGLSDPFLGWYYAEKDLYEKALNGEVEVTRSDVGHYLNIIDENYTTTGASWISFRSISGQVFDSYFELPEGFIYLGQNYSVGAMSAEDYEAMFMSYYNAVMTELKSAEKDLVDDARTKASSTVKAKQDAQTALKEAQEGYDKALAQYNLGSYGFFEWSAENGDAGAEFALALLKDEVEHDGSLINDVHQYLELGAENDATNLENMKESFKLIERSNQIREEHGVYVMDISSPCMAAAQLNLNFYTVNRTHAGIYNLAENLARGLDDPYYGWYDVEKDLYQRAKDGDKSISPDLYGHYLNLTDDLFYTTGYAWIENGQYAGQVFHDGSEWVDEFAFMGPTYSTGWMPADEYKAMFMTSYNQVTKELEEAKTVLEDAKKAVSQEEEDQKPNDSKEKEQAYQNAKTDYEDALAKLNAIECISETQIADAQKVLDEANSALEKAKEDCAKAAITVEEAQNSLAQANAKAQGAEEKEKQAASQLSAAETALNQIQARQTQLGFVNGNAKGALASKQAALDKLLAKGQDLDLLEKDVADKQAALETARKNEAAARDAVDGDAVKEAQAEVQTAEKAAEAALQALSEAKSVLDEKTTNTEAVQDNLNAVTALAEENKRLSAEIAGCKEQTALLETAEKDIVEQMEEWNTAQAKFHETEVLCQEKLDLAQALLDRIYEIGYDGKLHGFSEDLSEEFKACYKKADELQILFDETDAYGQENVAPAYADMTEKKTELDSIQEQLNQVSDRLETLLVNLENYLKSLEVSETPEEDQKPQTPETDTDTDTEKKDPSETSGQKDPVNGSGQNESGTASKPVVQTLKNPNTDSLPKSSAVTSALTGIAGYTTGAVASVAVLLGLYRRRNRKH